jgi:tripartite-type tricarboxylate transporter receptor subunit TctC
MTIRWPIGLFLAWLALDASALAQESVADFYRGKQIRLIVASAAGGGFDLYGRQVARHLGRHVPGNPTIVVQNMPGAGGMAAMNHLAARAAKDGLTIGVPQGPLLYAQIGKSPNVQFDMRAYSWLGSANVTSNTCVFTKRAGITSANDLVTKSVIVGGSGGSTEFVPNLLNALIGTKFNIVKGYKSTNDIIPAMERGEVDGLCGWGWDSARVIGRDYFTRGVFSVGLDCANEPHPELAARGVPFMMDLAKDDETKKVLSFLFSYLVFIRPFVGPPGIPDDRLKALQDAFAATLKDPELLAEADRSGVEIRYASPARVTGVLNDIFGAPEAIQLRALDELRKAGWEGLQR